MLVVDEYGAGPPLVLIHGSPANGNTWKVVGDVLSDRFRIIAPTLPGHETTAVSFPAMTTEEMGRAVAEAIGPANVPVRLAAHSFGANVALAIALAGRVAIDRMILFEPVTLKILPLVGKETAYENAKSAFDAYVERHRRGERQAVDTMIEFWFGPGAFERMPPPVKDYLIERTDVNIRDVHTNFGESYSPEALRRLRIPTTVIYGGASPKILETIADAVAAALGNASAVQLQEATHAMLVTHPETVADLIAAPGSWEAT